MKRIGDSDLYLTRDGHITTADGKPYFYKGKAVKLDTKTGLLITEDGQPIRDKNGNNILISESGRLITKNGEEAKGLIITDSEGKLLMPNGKLVTNTSDLEKIPNTTYSKTKDGIVIDSEGRPVKFNGDVMFVDEAGNLTNEKGRRLRYHGQALRIDLDGKIVDTKNERIELNDQIVSLEEIASLEKVDSVSETPPQAIIAIPEVPTVNESLAGQVPAQEPPLSDPKQIPNPASVEPKETDNAIDVSRESEAAKQRLAERFRKMVQRIEGEVSDIQKQGKELEQFNSSSQYVDLPETSFSREKPNNTEENATPPKPDKDITYGAGDNLYIVTTREMNSDLNEDLEAEILSGKRGDKVFLAKVYARIDLRYNNVVLNFYKICPLKSECEPLSGIGLDPATGSAGVAADVDTHFWYRYGGLFLAQFGSGVSQGITDSLDSETETVSDGTATSTIRTIKGLEYDQIIVKGIADTGNAFIPSLAARLDRKPTAYIPNRTEMILKLSEPLRL
jgi:hypothetical protein